MSWSLTLSGAVACALLVIGVARANDAQTHAAAGKSSYDAKRYREAADHYEAALALSDNANLLWNVARAWERAGELTVARDRYVRLLSRTDVDPAVWTRAIAALERITARLDARAAAPPGQARAEVLARERAEAAAEQNHELMAVLDMMIGVERGRRPPPKPLVPEPVTHVEGDGAGEWVLAIGGVALGGGGLAVALIGQGRIDALADDQEGAQVVTAITRKDAAAREREGRTLRIVGAIAGGVGAGLALTGLIMLLDDDRVVTAKHTHVGVVPLGDGVGITLDARF